MLILNRSYRKGGVAPGQRQIAELELGGIGLCRKAGSGHHEGTEQDDKCPLVPATRSMVDANLLLNEMG